MNTFTVPRAIVVGIVAGALGAAVNAATLALMDPSGRALAAVSFMALLSRVGWGIVWGLFFAFLYRFLPRGFVAQAVTVTLLTSAVAWVVVFPIKGVPFGAATIVRSLVANAAYAVVAVFVMRQALGLALPLIPIPRSAKEFSDNPAGV